MEEEKIIDDKYIYTKIQLQDGSVSDAILVAVDAENVKFNDGDNLVEKMALRASRKIYQDTGINFDKNIDISNIENVIALGEQHIIDVDNVGAIGRKNSVISLEDEEGNSIIPSENSFAEGENNIIKGSDSSHVEGMNNNILLSNFSHVEGNENSVNKDIVHSEGNKNIINSTLSHAIGVKNIIQEAANNSYVIGSDNIITRYNSLTFGLGLNNYFNNFFMKGTYNKEFEPEEYIVTTKDSEGNEIKEIKTRNYYTLIGNGTDNENRSNALVLDDSGDFNVKGKLSVPFLTGGFYGKFDRTKNKKRITHFIHHFGDCSGSTLRYYIGAGFIRENTFEDWEFQRIEEKFTYWEADEQKYILNPNNKNYTTLVNIHYYNDMKIIQEVEGYKKRYNEKNEEVAQFTKETKATNDGFLLVQFWTEVEKVSSQDDAIVKFDILIDEKSLENWIPMYSLAPGNHILELHCPLKNMEMDRIYNVKINARCQSGEITIDTRKIKILMYGEGIGIGEEIPKKEEIEGDEKTV